MLRCAEREGTDVMTEMNGNDSCGLDDVGSKPVATNNATQNLNDPCVLL